MNVLKDWTLLSVSSEMDVKVLSKAVLLKISNSVKTVKLEQKIRIKLVEQAMNSNSTRWVKKLLTSKKLFNEPFAKSTDN